MKRLAFITVLVVVANTAILAQLNDSTHHYISYASTGIINKTNTNRSYVLTNLLKFTLDRKQITLNAAASYVYGQLQETKTNNDFSSTVDFDLYKNIHRFYYWGLGSYDKSYSLKVNDRLQAGAGVAYNFFKGEKALLVLSDGLLYERSDLFDANGTRDIYQTVRNSARLKFKWIITDLLTLDGTHFLQNSLTVKNDYIIKSSTSLSLKLRKWLSFSTALQYNKITRSDRENLLLTFGLTAERFF